MRNARARLHGNRHAHSFITFRVAAAVRMPVSTHIHRLTLALALPSPRSLQIFSPRPRRRGLCSSAAIFYHRSLAPSAPPLPRKITFLPFCSDLPGSFRRRHYRFCAVSPTAFLSGNILCLHGFSQIKKESGDSFSNRHGAVSHGSCKYCSAAFVLCRARSALQKVRHRLCLPGALSHRSSSIALDLAYAVDFASKKSVLMRFALEYWLTHAMESGSFSYPSYRLPKPMPLARRLPRYLM